MKTNPTFVDKLATTRMNQKFTKFFMSTMYKGSINLLTNTEEMNNDNKSDSLWKKYDRSNKYF